jgi:hypothetical protein
MLTPNSGCGRIQIDGADGVSLSKAIGGRFAQHLGEGGVAAPAIVPLAGPAHWHPIAARTVPPFPTPAAVHPAYPLRIKAAQPNKSGMSAAPESHYCNKCTEMHAGGTLHSGWNANMLNIGTL